MTETPDAEIAIPVAVSEMLRGMIAGERTVEAVSNAAAALRSSGPYPHRYLVRQMRGELNFEADLETTVRFLWFEKKAVRPSTTVRVRMAFEPSLDPPLPIPGSSDLVMAVPRFLDHGGNVESLDLNLLDGRALKVDFDSTDDVKKRRDKREETIKVDGKDIEFLMPEAVTTADEGSAGPQSQTPRWPVPAEWPMNDIVPLLDTIAEWRLGRMSARNVGFSERPDKAHSPGRRLPQGLDALSRVLKTIIDGCEQVSSGLHRASAKAGSGAMQISELSATVRVHLDDKGNVERGRERPESSQQLDLSVIPGAATGNPQTLITFDLPDFLVAGELRDKVLDKLRPQEQRDRIEKALNEGATDGSATLSQEQISALLEASKQPGCGIVIRAGHGLRRNDSDTDLVLLQDETGPGRPGILLEVKFRKSEKAGEPAVEEIRKIDLVAYRRDGTWQGSGIWFPPPFALQAPYYFARLLRTLHTLQKCVAAGLEREGKTR